MTGAIMTTNNEERFLCKTSNLGKQGTRIPKSKYDLIRGAIRRSVPKGTNGIELKDLSAKVKQNLSAKQRNDLGSVSWHFMHVKLDLEVRGELERIPGSSPQRVRRVI